MPKVEDDELISLLASGRIAAISLDTNIFDRQKLRLDTEALVAISKLHRKKIHLILSGTVVRELRRHIQKQLDDALSEVKKAVGSAIFAFGLRQPSRDEIIKMITNDKRPLDVAEDKISTFLKTSMAEVLADEDTVGVRDILDMYFDNKAPFSHGKKTEFPDAFALRSLEMAAANRGYCILIVSADSDWKKYCHESPLLYIVDNVEKALSLIENAPDKLRLAVFDWILNDSEGKDIVGNKLMDCLERLDVDVTADPTSGQVEIHAWAPEIVSIEWPSKDDIDIIQTNKSSNGEMIVVLSFVVSVRLNFTVELAFSFWDSVDRESVGMGGRTVEHSQDEDVRVTLTIKCQNLGEKNQEFSVQKIATDIKYFAVELGSVDVFDEGDIDQ